MTPHQLQSARETQARVLAGTDPWVAIGDFLDDWRRAGHADHAGMISQDLERVESLEDLRWSALIAAIVDQSAHDPEPRIVPPAWVVDDAYVLPEPWFLLPGWRLRMHQLVDTPGAFKRRDIHGGDRILSRV